MKTDTYQVVTDAIMAKLEAGTIPWKHFAASPLSQPKNLASGKAYHGINYLLLDNFKYGSPWWMTYKQAQERGGHIKQGEKATLVVFWKWLEIEDPDKQPGEVSSKDKRIPMLRHYYVFNAEQTEGVEYPKAGDSAPRESKPIDTAEALIQGMQNRPDIIFHDKPRAYYSSQHDEVFVTRRELCVSDEAHYETLLHELVHSTGHKNRLNRFEDEKNTHAFGSKVYAQEELTAEIGAGFLCAECGIFQQIADNSAAYIANWLTALKNDKSLVIRAAGKAQKAFDYITNQNQGNHKQ